MLYTKLVKNMGIVICLCFLQQGSVHAQDLHAPADTLRLDIKQAEKIFLEKNLSLLAAHYDIDIAKAQEQQAKLWDNPVLNTDQNVYSNAKWFEHGTKPDGSVAGQYYIQVQQLIKTANKRGRLIQMAKTNTAISEWQFKDLMNNLKYQLRSDFYTIAQLEDNRRLYQMEMQQLDVLVNGMNAQYKAGNIARKDLLRIQALQIATQQEATDNDKQLEDAQAELKTMLQITGNTFIMPLVNDVTLPSVNTLNVTGITDVARQNNAAYQLQQLQVQYQQQNLSYQKALAVPDVTLGPNFDNNSNYISNYVGLGISLPLPVLNRNQGNIKAARWQVKQEETNMQQADQQLQNNIQCAYNKLLYTLKISSSTQQTFYSDYNGLYNNIVESYKQRQIGLVDFIDYFNAYKDIRQKQMQQQLNLQLAKEDLNLQAGTDIIQ
jgi:cobalt-zinc-cadmium efflux system outer membrane protein